MDVGPDGTIRIGLGVVSNGQGFGAITAEDGSLLSAVRLIGTCSLAPPTLTGTLFTYMVAKSVTEYDTAALVGTLPDTSLRLVTLPLVPAKVPQWLTQNQARVVWWWVPGDQLSSFSAIDGSDFRFFVSATSNGPVVALRTPVGFTDGFLYESIFARDGASDQHTVFVSAGVDPGEQLVASEPGYDYGQAEYLHTHIAWLRGANLLSTNTYGSVELWAATWSAGVLGAPARVGTVDTPIPGSSLSGYGMPPETAGGFGHYLAPWGDGKSLGWVDVWNVVGGTSVRYFMPPTTPALAPSGVTPTHAYVNTRTRDMPIQMRLLRFRMDQ